MSKGKLINYAKNGKRNNKPLDQVQDTLNKKLDQQNHIYEAVMQDLNDDYFTYINDLVKATKTPIKQKVSRQKLQVKCNNKDVKDLKDLKLNEQLIKQKKSSSRQKKQDIHDTSIYQRISVRRQQRKQQRPKFFNNQSHTEKSQSNNNVLRFLKESQIPQINRRHKTNAIPHSLNSKDNEISEDHMNFIQNINEYVNILQNRENSTSLMQKRSTNINRNNNLLLQQILTENKKLKRELNLYKQKFKQIQMTVQLHYNHLKNRQKQYKNKIKQLNKALVEAVQKINDQKDEIQELQSFLDNFTNQVTVYKSGKNHKSRLRHLLKGDKQILKDSQKQASQQNLLKSLNSEDLKLQQQLGLRIKQRGALYSEDSEQVSEQQLVGLSKIMNTTSVLPASRLKSKKLIPKIDITTTAKSKSKQSKSNSMIYQQRLINNNKNHNVFEGLGNSKAFNVLSNSRNHSYNNNNNHSNILQHHLLQQQGHKFRQSDSDQGQE